MPAITATVHQVLRYFFVGAIAATFIAVPRGAHWSCRFLQFLEHAEKPGVVVAMVIGGSLIYGAHRVLIYPGLSRFIIRTVMGPEPPRRRRWFNPFGRRLNPYGRALEKEIEFENRGVPLSAQQRERFAGWASENHVFYCATEIAAFTLVWPGWRVPGLCGWLFALGLAVLFCFICAWDIHAFSVMSGLKPEAIQPT